MNEAERMIREEIQRQGVISFARFMELALYAPGAGYYERNPDPIGRRGDFLTSVSVGPLFGQLLGFQFAEWLNDFHAPRIVECGAHDGRLACDILDWVAAHVPTLAGRLEYFLIEPSPQRREWQQTTLKNHLNRIRWFGSIEELAPFEGVFFANELFDAFPTRRIGWNAETKEWFEWGVALDGTGALRWERINLERAGPQLPVELAAILPNDFTTEMPIGANRFWGDMARKLKRGKLVTVDYGLEGEEFFHPHRAEGTIRALWRHHPSSDLLANPGEQDLTAEVNVTALLEAGESAGLKNPRLIPQSKFLVEIMGKALKQSDLFGTWPPERVRQFQTLTHPDHFGRRFRVLIQEKA